MPTDYGSISRMFKQNTDFSVFTGHGLRNEFMIAAIHGGSIQLHTSDMAKTIAGQKHGVYLFEGHTQNASQSLYMRSDLFDEPQFSAMANQYNRIVAIHGLAAARGDAVLVGGLDHELAHKILDDLNHEKIAARPYTKPVVAVSRDNVCNRGILGKGVQLEIPKAMRMIEALRADICQIIDNSLPLSP